MGTPAFAVPPLEALAAAGHEIVAVVAQPDRPAGRGHATRELATKAWARAHGATVLQPENVRGGGFAAELASLGPDVLAVAAYGRILGADLLTLAPYGALNVHASLLPKYRGAAPIQWALANGELESGVTIMQMDEGLDTGDVLLQRATSISPEENAEMLAARLASLGGDALVQTLRLLSDGVVVPVRQDQAKATLAPILTRGDGRVDWSMPAARIAGRMRGFSPWPGAWTTLDGRPLKLIAATPLAGSAAEGEPGAGRRATGRGLAVSCGEGTALLLTRVQPEGKAVQDALAYLNGLRRDALVLGT